MNSTGRERELESGAASRSRLVPQATLVSFDDRAADRQSEPHSIGLGRKEWIEKSVRDFGVEPRSVVANLDMYGAGFIQPAAQRQGFPVHVFGRTLGVEAVTDQVHQNLLNLYLVGLDRRKAFREIQSNFHRFRSCLGLDEREDIVDQAVDAYRSLVGGRLAGEFPNSANNLSGPLRLAGHQLQRLDQLFPIDVVRVQQHHAGLCVSCDRGEGLVQLVGEFGGHLSRYAQSRHVRQLHFQVARFLFGFLSLLDLLRKLMIGVCKSLRTLRDKMLQMRACFLKVGFDALPPLDVELQGTVDCFKLGNLLSQLAREGFVVRAKIIRLRHQFLGFPRRQQQVGTGSQGVDSVQQQFLFPGFDEKSRGSEPIAEFPVGIRRVGAGIEDNRDGTESGIGLAGSTKGEAIHDWHQQIRNDEVRLLRASDIQGFLTVARFQYFVPAPSNQVPQDYAIRRDVVRDQDSHSMGAAVGKGVRRDHPRYSNRQTRSPEHYWMREETPEARKPLRSGYTTGACATAASLAAARAALTGDCSFDVRIRLPRGQEVVFQLSACRADERSGFAATIKDAGDDPDCTHGAVVNANVTLSARSGVRFYAGKGVGTVTREGLELAVGEPAINPVPRRMVEDHLGRLACSVAYEGGFEVTIGVENGAALALKTMNPRLGIVGGLSILGTTGIVRPYSCSAYIASIHQGIDVARANGIEHIAACTGSTSESAMRRLHGFSDMALVEMGDFVGAVLKHLRKAPVPRLSLAGGFGKISKLAAGHIDLHSRKCSVDFPMLGREAAVLGAHPDLVDRIRAANTSVAALACAREQRIELGDRVCVLAREVARTRTSDLVDVEVWAVDRKGKTIGHAGFRCDRS